MIGEQSLYRAVPAAIPLPTRTTIIRPTRADYSPALSVDTPLTYEVAEVLYAPEMWDRVTDDFSPPPEAVPVPPLHYLGGYVDGRIAAVFSLHAYKKGWRVHFMVPKASRRYARIFIGVFIERAPRPLYAVIPTLYRAVINFAIDAGFHVEHTSRRSHRKRGVWYDDVHLVLK